MTREQGESTAPSCSVSGGNRSRGAAATSETNAINERGEHNIFGDMNLNMVMMFMLLLHFMQYAMRTPCGC